jgi:2-polyprenyl-3-methyl-5-hydroxy-6-metoxy-1,4-benzoquinol methylase
MSAIPLPSSSCPLCARMTTVRFAIRTEKDRQWNVARCRSCKLVFSDPQPSESDIRSFYAGDYHSDLRQLGASEKAFGQKFDSYCEWLLGYVKPGRSLDIGCGTGLFVKKLRDRGFQAEGHEANALSAEWGRSHYGMTIRVGILDPHTLQPGRYDLITLCDVLEHTGNPLEYLCVLRKLLHPSSYVMVTFPHIWSIESLYYRALSKLLRRNWVWQTCNIPYHTWEFTPHTARRVFEQAGFRIVAFRRRQDMQKEPIDWQDLVTLIRIPTRILWFRPLGNRLGSQMHFLLRPQ